MDSRCRRCSPCAPCGRSDLAEWGAAASRDPRVPIHSIGAVGDATALVVLVPEAEPVLAIANAQMPAEKRLTAPAHITLIYPFMPPELISEEALTSFADFFDGFAPLSFELTIGWFGREVLLLVPTPSADLVALTDAVLARWREYPYYAGAYDTIEPHLSLGFGDAELLEPIAAALEPSTPLTVNAAAVSLLVGVPEAMKARDSFPLRG